MKRLLTSVAVLFLLSLIGCGGGDQGPASPDDTPTVNEAEIQQTLERSMPPDMKEKYGK